MLSSSEPGPARRAPARATFRRTLIGWSFALPFVIVFAVFMAGPILASFVLSFTSFGLRDLRDPLGADFVGLDNYAALFSDSKFLRASANTIYFVLVGVPLTLAAGLFVAVGIDRGIRRFRSLFRVGYYLPVVTSIVAIAVIWRYVLHPDFGLANGFLRLFGFEGASWLSDPLLAMPSIIAMAVWRNMGASMIIFIAGLQTIPAEVYEAAAIDGAGRWQTFRSVTLPLLRPTMLFTLVVTSIGYLQLFEEPFVMTNGGPLDATLSVAMYLYQQGFNFFNQGYAAAMAYVLFLAIVVLTIVQFRFLRPQT